MNNVSITSAEDLITSPEQTRAGFVEAALEKNRKAQPLIDKARSLKSGHRIFLWTSPDNH